MWLYAATGVALWYCLLMSGVNADIAGVVTAMAVPGAALAPKDTKSLPLEPETLPTLFDHLIYNLVPYTSLLIMPVFALANTAVPIDLSMLSTMFTERVSLGIMAGLVLGKPLGITLFSILAVKAGIAKMPSKMETKHLAVLGLLGGVGFTMCLFLIALALAQLPDAMRLAKLAVMSASVIAAVLSGAIMQTFPVIDNKSASLAD